MNKIIYIIFLICGLMVSNTVSFIRHVFANNRIENYKYDNKAEKNNSIKQIVRHHSHASHFSARSFKVETLFEKLKSSNLCFISEVQDNSFFTSKAFLQFKSEVRNRINYEFKFDVLYFNKISAVTNFNSKPTSMLLEKVCLCINFDTKIYTIFSRSQIFVFDFPTGKASTCRLITFNDCSLMMQDIIASAEGHGLFDIIRSMHP